MINYEVEKTKDVKKTAQRLQAYEKKFRQIKRNKEVKKK